MKNENVVKALTSNQLRRLKAGMADPCQGHVGILIRKDHLAALCAMIERREQVMVDFVTALEDQDMSTIKELCSQFWMSQDKWNDGK